MVAGVVLGVVAVGTGGAALAAEGTFATATLSTASVATGAGATGLDGAKCVNGDDAACAGAGLGVAALAFSGPEYLAARGLVGETGVTRGLAGAGLAVGAYGTVADLLAGDPKFLSPLFGC